MLTAVDKGYTPAPRSLTFGEYAASWLEIRSRHVRPITANAYRPYVNHAVRAFGARRLADISRADDERLAAALDTAGRSRRTTGMLLYVVRAIFAAALDDGCVTRNPATKVQPSGRAAAPRSAFGAADLGTLRAHAAMDRLHAYWLLTLAGLRRSEVLGLRWSDVDMTAGPVTIARGVVADRSGRWGAETAPKTTRGARTLPVPADILAALRTLRDAQAATFGLRQIRTGWLAVDEAGEPHRPEQYSKLCARLCTAVGVPLLRLHSARHTSVSRILDADVQPRIAAVWHGHDVITMSRTYDHPDADQLGDAGRALFAAP